MSKSRFWHSDIKQLAVSILKQIEVPEADANEVAECLLKADLQGAVSTIYLIIGNDPMAIDSKILKWSKST